ncbi:MAG: hypothetical protein ACR2H4_04575 [Pyrinomonadaceae bacterium]
MICANYKDNDGLWRRYLKSANDEKIANAARVTAKKECKHAIDPVKARPMPLISTDMGIISAARYFG